MNVLGSLLRDKSSGLGIPTGARQELSQMAAVPQPPFQGRIRGVAGGQVGEQKAPAGFFLPLFNPGPAVRPRSSPRLCADGRSARSGASPSSGPHLNRGLTLIRVSPSLGFHLPWSLTFLRASL